MLNNNIKLKFTIELMPCGNFTFCKIYAQNRINKKKKGYNKSKNDKNITTKCRYRLKTDREHTNLNITTFNFL